MFAIEYQAIEPAAPGRTFSREASDCLEQLGTRLKGKTGRVLALTFFAATSGSRDYSRKKRVAARALLRAGIRAPWSFIAQPPAAPMQVSLYAETMPLGARPVVVRRRRAAGFPYVVVESGRDRTLFAAGLAAGGQKSSWTRSRAALVAAGRILAREGLSAGDITRQWNYLQDILAVGSSRCGSRQNYQAFNERRREFYAAAAFPTGYPAATGIGTRDGGVVIEFRAATPRRSLRIVPLSNPLQKNAHRYSGEVLVGGFGPGGRPKAAPLFERAKFVGDGASGVVYVSGTAAIRGQSTVARGDAAAQARITIENIRRLVSPGNLRRHGINARGRSGPFAYLRAYVRRARDLPAVRSACRAAFGGIPAHFVLADICRDDLLVEMEGVLAIKFEKGN